ncbi:hypothetical protein MTR_4g094350 [Medicago truncatula]|uniref:Uncharacterized protein n=1 Tax=Medicago truncatula TaxID=3880 RepID=A0A072UN94_MEDTR|nr:hypothetical protein MTR_4g094350 [Medicago truncatula]
MEAWLQYQTSHGSLFGNCSLWNNYYCYCLVHKDERPSFCLCFLSSSTPTCVCRC